MKNEEIYNLVEKQETVLKEAVELKLSGFKAEIKSGMDMQVYKLDQLIDYQKKQNGRLDRLENDTRIWRLIHRNPKTAGIVLGLALVGLIALFVIKNLIL